MSTAAVTWSGGQCQVSPIDEADSKLSLSEHGRISLLFTHCPILLSTYMHAAAGHSYIQSPIALYYISHRFHQCVYSSFSLSLLPTVLVW